MPDLSQTPAARTLGSPIRGLIAIAATAVVLGVLGGVAWWAIVDLPSYRVNDDGAAIMGERDLVAIFGTDAWFVTIGLAIGLLVGILAAARLARGMGWRVVLVAAAGALLAAGLCWLTGWLLGPGAFETRLEQARAGDLVPVELTVTSWSALAAWPFAAVLPVLVWATAAKDPEDAKPLFRRRPRRAWSATPVASELPAAPGQQPVDAHHDPHHERAEQHQPKHR